MGCWYASRRWIGIQLGLRDVWEERAVLEVDHIIPLEDGPANYTR